MLSHHSYQRLIWASPGSPNPVSPVLLRRLMTMLESAVMGTTPALGPGTTGPAPTNGAFLAVTAVLSSSSNATVSWAWLGPWGGRGTGEEGWVDEEVPAAGPPEAWPRTPNCWGLTPAAAMCCRGGLVCGTEVKRTGVWGEIWYTHSRGPRDMPVTKGGPNTARAFKFQQDAYQILILKAPLALSHNNL